MPGFVLHVGAKVQCAHTGQATPTSANPRVFVSGQAIVTTLDTHAIVGCTLPTNAGGPCATARWVRGAIRVRSNGMPVLLQDSQAICAPTGTPLLPTAVQTRVFGM